MPATFLHLLQQTFTTHAARPAVVHRGQTFTYGELDAHTRGNAAWLQGWGIEKGDRVALCTSNKFAFLCGHLAAIYAGAISLPLNPRFTREELRFFLTDSGARAAVVGREEWNVIGGLQEEWKEPDVLRSVPELRYLVSDGIMQEGNVGQEYRCPTVTDDDPCLILYSSGTTGWPKGVVHTHGNIASSLRALQSCWRFTPDDVVLNVLPLFHIHGLCFATQLTLLTGGCLILEDFEPQATMQRVQDCTVFMAVPTIYYRFLEQPNFRAAAQSWQRTRLFTCGSAPIRAEVLPELEAILGKPVINRYGMTEAFVITSLPLEGPWPYGSVGLPLPGMEVRVVTHADPVGQALLPAQESAGKSACPTIGAVQLRGPNLFREYWNKPDATQAALADGWFDTGDLGFLDAAGLLTLVGRKNDLIITSGFNVYPQVVERVINDCPGVRESAVVGVPDERKGERVVAVVVRADATLNEERLRAFWSDRLVDYQRPKDVVFVDALPRNAMGKVLRRELPNLIGPATGEAS